MNLKPFEQSLIPLLLATLLLGLFYWQFTQVYTFLTNNFYEEKLFILYAHLLIYLFLVLSLFVSFSNLINLVLKSKVFITTTILVVLTFYALSFAIVKDVIIYFIDYPLDENTMMSLILFIVGISIYSLYSIVILFFNKFVPFSHLFIFMLLSIGYSLWFIETQCYPIDQLSNKFL